MASQEPGWYPDPNDDDVELYWDGASWHGRREKRRTPASERTAPSLAGSASTQAQPVSADGRVGWWAGKDPASKKAIVVIGSFIAGFIALAVVISVLVAKPWESSEYKQCVAQLEEQYGSSLSDSFIDDGCSAYTRYQ